MVRFVIVLGCVLSFAENPAHANPPNNIDLLKKSRQFLEADGRAWFEGDIPIQKSGCVSCHQVPSGLWALAASYSALDQPLSSASKELLRDAIDSTEDPAVGVAAMWSMIKIAVDQSASTDLDVIERFKASILDAQRDDGSWPAKGQFPTQRRPIAESDAVVTMAMLFAFKDVDDAQIMEALRRARKYISQSQGKTTEYRAWRMLTTEIKESQIQLANKLIAEQQQSGGWGWQVNEPESVYATAVATFALSWLRPEQSRFVAARDKAIGFLVSRNKEGKWDEPSKLISKKPSAKRDYVYRYWATAWATIALASEYGR